MKNVLPICLMVLLTACTTTKIFVVRHAEKINAGSMTSGADPGLTPEGRQRALVLRDTLRRDSLNGIFATQFQRTFETAEPTAIAQRVTMRRYQANAGNTLLDSLSHLKKQKFLVVGHSNTVLPMLQSIGLRPTLSTIPETDFDNLFVVTVQWFWGRKVRLKETTYGRPTQ